MGDYVERIFKPDENMLSPVTFFGSICTPSIPERSFVKRKDSESHSVLDSLIIRMAGPESLSGGRPRVQHRSVGKDHRTLSSSLSRCWRGFRSSFGKRCSSRFRRPYRFRSRVTGSGEISDHKASGWRSPSLIPTISGLSRKHRRNHIFPQFFPRHDGQHGGR